MGDTGGFLVLWAHVGLIQGLMKGIKSLVAVPLSFALGCEVAAAASNLLGFAALFEAGRHPPPGGFGAS